ncbi:MAG: serine/threonine protein kinase, partial [Acidobacteria bacterium]|nr:serine/threonine protein kinase [Acidobacteriota bacterium]
MNTQRWQQVKAILDRALDLPPTEVGPLLDQLCREDLQLRREVDSFLEAREEAEAFIEVPVVRLSYPIAETEPLGARFGAYEIREVLGRGGMGTVYRAERADGAYRAEAALKILHRGIDTDEIVRRFEAERQILASLRHHYIAELLDGGSTEDGRPFLVMEYIDGIPIDQFCDERRWSLRPRLELFLKVCQAVEHAHRAMVVHRDLKPANILVLEDGEPKLLDFGIAKLLETEAGATVLTRGPGPRIFTPGYASPEQLRGEAVRAASDTYSLGVLLYQLLTGRRPYPIPETSPELAGRNLETLAIERPSTVVRKPYRRTEGEAGAGTSASDLSPEELAGQRSEEPKALQRLLSGDLDSILLKALRPEPEERYGSVAELARDIEAFLEDRPVLARQGTFRYRSSKFLRRHKLPIAIAGGLLLLGCYASWQSWSAFEQKHRAEAQQLRTAVEASKAKELEDFLIDFLAGSDPDDEQWRGASLEDVLERGAKILPSRLKNQPEVRANLVSTMGRTYQMRSDFGEARGLLEDALAQRRSLFGEEHEQVALSKIHLGFLDLKLRRLEEAESLTRQGLETLERRLGTTEPAWIAMAENNLGVILQDQGRFEEAEALFRRSLAKKRWNPGPETDDFATGLHNLAAVVVAQGRNEEALPIYRRALELKRRIGEGETISASRTLVNLGSLLTDRGDLEEAEAHLREALRIRRQRLKEGNQEIGSALNSLGVLLVTKGDYNQAESVLAEQEVIFRKAFGETGANFGILLCNQARLDLALGRFRQAEDRTRRA